MEIRLYNTITLLVFASIFTSCDPTMFPSDPYIVANSRQKENVYYIPSAANAPLLTQKNELSFSVLASPSDEHTAVDLHSAIAAGKNFGLLSSFAFHKDNNSKFVKINRFEFGAGYFKPLSSFWHFETYGGIGFGNTDNTHHTGSSRIKTTQFFLQPAIAVSTINKTVQFAFVSRFSGVNFNVSDTSFSTDREPLNARQLEAFQAKPLHVFWEPGIIFRAGLKNIQAHTGYTFSSDLTNGDYERVKGNFQIGLTLRLDAATKK